MDGKIGSDPSLVGMPSAGLAGLVADWLVNAVNSDCFEDV
jgi:hypothetical protein